MQLPGIYVEIKGDYSHLEKNITAAKALVSKQAAGISNALNNALSPRQIQTHVNSLTSNFGVLNRASDMAGKNLRQVGVDLGELSSITGLTDKQLQSFQSRLLKTQASNAQINALKRLKKQLNLSKKEVRALGNQFGLTSKQIREVNNVTFGSHISSVSKLKTSWLGAMATITSVYLIMRKIADLGGDIYSVGAEAAQMNKAFGEITGSVDLATAELSYLRDVADALGQNFWDLQDAYKGILAASQSTNFTMEQTHKIFTAVTKASATLGLSADRTKLTLYAVEQMMSKGKISSEELRRQMGDNLPGAFLTAARAMNMTAQELDAALKAGEIYAEDFLPKFADALEMKYSGEVAESIAATNKWNEAIKDLKCEIAEGGFLEQMADSLRGMTEAIKDQEFQGSLGSMAEAFAVMSESAPAVMKFLADRVVNFAHAGAGEGLVSAGALTSTEFATMSPKEIAKVLDAFNENPEVYLLKRQIEDIEETLTAFENAPAFGARRLKQMGTSAEELRRQLNNLNKSLEDASKVMPESVQGLGANLFAGMENSLFDPTIKLPEINTDLLRPDAGNFKVSFNTSAFNSSVVTDNEIDPEEFEKNRISFLKSIQSDQDALDAWLIEQKKYVETEDEMARLMQLYAEKQEAITSKTDVAKYLEDLQKQGESLTSSLMLPVEILTEKQDLYNEMLDAGTISQETYNRAVAQAQKEYDETDEALIRHNKLMEEGAELTASMADPWDELSAKLRRYSQLLGEEAINYSTWMKATKEAWAEYDSDLEGTSASVKTLQEELSDAWQQFGNDWATGLNEMLWGSETTFEDIAKAFAKMITQIIIQKTILKAFGGNTTGDAIVSAIGEHSGGVVGSESTFTRNVSSTTFLGASRYHTGLAGDEFPAILQKGESVLTKGQMKALGAGIAGNGSKSVQNNFDSSIIIHGNVDSKDRAEEVRQACRAEFYKLIQKEKRYGGVLA